MMIGEPARDRRNLFDQMLTAAMEGEPPVTETGMNDAVLEALMRVAVLRTQESADAARSVFNEEFGSDAAPPPVTN